MTHEADKPQRRLYVKYMYIYMYIDCKKKNWGDGALSKAVSFPAAVQLRALQIYIDTSIQGGCIEI